MWVVSFTELFHIRHFKWDADLDLSSSFICRAGQEKIRPLWRHYYQNTQGIIFVVDSADTARLDSEGDGAKEELERMLSSSELDGVPLLVFANKQDMPRAAKPADIAAKLGLAKLRNRQWYIQGSCAAQGEGLFEGLEWLSKTVQTS